MKNYLEEISNWVFCDSLRLEALKAVQALKLPDCYIAAGFLRNLAWDKYHGYLHSAPLNDLDVIYFDPDCLDENSEKELVIQLSKELKQPWSVKNQARMHIPNNSLPYLSSLDAMKYWPELETAVGVRLAENNELQVISPFNLGHLFKGTITRNFLCRDSALFGLRLEKKKWQTTWPRLKVVS